ncbi:MAG: hypothetical protein IKB07_08965 [Lachnospiraceae bacterium]|nr:hypothetical protein [Lachnospiraceae bacterium]
MGTVCRPLLLYNEFLPAEISDRERDWDYQAFGHYDGISIEGRVILKDMSDLSSLFEKSKDYETSGSYFTHVLWGLYGNEEEEEAFWRIDAPFIYVCLMQLSDDTKAALENRYNNTREELQKAGAGCLLYHSLDNSDMILVIKSETAEEGFKIINDLHYEQREDCLKLRNTYSIMGVRRNVIDSDINRVRDNDIVPMVELQVVEKNRECTELLYQRIKEQLRDKGYGDEVIWRKSVLGTEDDTFFMRNISWKAFLSFFKKESGLLCNSNLCTQNYAYAVSTRVLFKENKTIVEESQKKKTITNMNMERPFCDMLASFVKATDSKVFSDVEMKNLLMLINAFRRFEYVNRDERPFSDYTFFPLFLPFYQFIVLSSGKERECVRYHYSFMECMKLCTQNFVKPERIYSQITDFNIKYFDMPIKFITLYNSYIYAIKQVLNVRNVEDARPATTYEFLMCAGLNDDIEVMELFPCRENSTKRLFLIRTPEKYMYNIKAMLFALGHETAHFVGKKIRNREGRYKHILTICARMIGLAMKGYYEHGEEISGSVIKAENVKKFEEKVKKWIDAYISLNQNEQYLRNVNSYMGNESSKDSIEESKGFNKQYEYHAEVLRWNLSGSIKNVLSDRGIDLLSFMIDDEFEACYGSDDEREWEVFYTRTKSHLQDYINAFCGVTVNSETTLSIEFILNNIFYFMKECYADVICILLLKLSLEDYITSIMTLSEQKRESMRGFCQSKIMIRIALVYATMSQPLEDMPDCFRWDEEQYKNHKEWSKDCKELFETVLGFVENYIYDGYADFKTADFVKEPWLLFTDNYVLRQFVDYLYSCSKSFFREILKDDVCLKTARNLYQMQNETNVNVFFSKMLNGFRWYEEGVNDVMTELASGKMTEQI